MGFRINKIIESESKTTYATEDEISEELYKIDCSDGINIISISDRTREAFENLDFDKVKSYPHSTSLKKAIINLWRDSANLKNSNITLTNGSMEGVVTANRLFLENNDIVLGIAPTFSEAEADVRMYGAKYDAVFLKAENNYRFDCEEFLNRLTDKHKMVYIDNPNNPTGQIISIADIEKIAQKADELNIGVVIDEAYGEYMARGNSAINLIDKWHNIIVLRTFSKGYGLAGLRAGYMVYSDEIARFIGNITCPYNISSLARSIARQVVEDEEFLNHVRELTSRIKGNFTSKSWKNLSFSHTGDTVSIVLISHKNTDLNLAEAFAKYKIRVIPADSFSGIGKNSVRFRIPKEEDILEVLKAMEEIDKIN